MFLGVAPQLTNWSADAKECSLILDENPLTMFVELPEKHSNISYSNIICGVLRGSLQMVTHSPFHFAGLPAVPHAACAHTISGMVQRALTRAGADKGGGSLPARCAAWGRRDGNPRAPGGDAARHGAAGRRLAGGGII